MPLMRVFQFTRSNLNDRFCKLRQECHYCLRKGHWLFKVHSVARARNNGHPGMRYRPFENGTVVRVRGVEFPGQDQRRSRDIGEAAFESGQRSGPGTAQAVCQPARAVAESLFA